MTIYPYRESATARFRKTGASDDVGIVLDEVYSEVDFSQYKVVIKDILPGTLAHDDGVALSVGDSVLLINGQEIPSAATAQRLLKEAPAGDVEVKVLRPATERTVLLRKPGGEDQQVLAIEFDRDVGSRWSSHRVDIKVVPPGETAGNIARGDTILAINRVSVTTTTTNWCVKRQPGHPGQLKRPWVRRSKSTNRAVHARQLLCGWR